MRPVHLPVSAALAAVLDELAELVAAKVLAKLAAPSSHYGTGRAATLPPGKSKAWALRTLKTIPGARKVGRDWLIAVGDYEAWLTERDAARCTPRPKKVTSTVEALAEQALLECGMRRVG